MLDSSVVKYYLTTELVILTSYHMVVLIFLCLLAFCILATVLSTTIMSKNYSFNGMSYEEEVEFLVEEGMDRKDAEELAAIGRNL